MIWDKYFYDICTVVAEKSPCLAKKRGAILVRDNVIISTGYNGPARSVPHCGKERNEKDRILNRRLPNEVEPLTGDHTVCPRYRLGYGSGRGLDLCPAAHAETNCIATAARLGTCTKDSIMYVNFGVPCKDCLTLMKNAGVIGMVVTDSEEIYDTMTDYILTFTGMWVRQYASGIVLAASYEPYAYPSSESPESSET